MFEQNFLFSQYISTNEMVFLRRGKCLNEYKKIHLMLLLFKNSLIRYHELINLMSTWLKKGEKCAHLFKGFGGCGQKKNCVRVSVQVDM